jgi:hypothetical protein
MSNPKAIISGFEFLPAVASNNYIEIYPPFSKFKFFSKNLNLLKGAV